VEDAGLGRLDYASPIVHGRGEAMTLLVSVAFECLLVVFERGLRDDVVGGGRW
jgi:hypothetical protein